MQNKFTQHFLNESLDKMIIKHHDPKVVGNYDFHFPPQASYDLTYSWPHTLQTL